MEEIQSVATRVEREIRKDEKSGGRSCRRIKRLLRISSCGVLISEHRRGGIGNIHRSGRQHFGNKNAFGMIFIEMQ